MSTLTQDWPTLLAAVVVGILGVARLTRLVVDDDWPPIKWARNVWNRAWGNSDWGALIECPFCVAPYLTAASMAWALLADLPTAWWVFHGWLAASYVAAMINVRDIPDPDTTRE